MDESVVQTISTILYYIDEYKAGNPDVDDKSMKLIAKQVLKLTSKNNIEFLLKISNIIQISSHIINFLYYLNLIKICKQNLF